MWRVLLFRLLSLVIGVLPLGLVYRLARLPALALSLAPTRRHVALRENISVAHGLPPAHPRVRRDVRRAFWHTLLNYVDVLRLDRADAVPRIRRIPIPDLRPINEALAAGKGVILASAHLGNMDTVIQTLALRGYKVLIPTEAIRPPELRAFMQAQREALGIRIEPIGLETTGRMIAQLRAGGIVVIVSDRDVQQTGMPVTFFGREVRLPTAAILLALRTGVPVIGAFGYRHRDGSISGRLTSPLPLPSAGADRPRHFRADLAEGMRVLAALLEREIRLDPGQWVVQQPIFSAAQPTIPARLRGRLARRVSRPSTAEAHDHGAGHLASDGGRP